MKKVDLDFNLPREPKSHLDFLRMVGFVKWFDWIFVGGLFLLPVFITRFIYVLVVSTTTNDVLNYTAYATALGLVYVAWCCCLVGRLLHFSLQALAKLILIQEDMPKKP